MNLDIQGLSSVVIKTNDWTN